MLHATWVSGRAPHYRRPGGPWDSAATLDALSFSGELVAGSVRVSADQADDAVRRVAGGLRAAGARRGRAVTWQLRNGIASSILYRACWRLGAVAAPVLPSLGASDSPAGTVDPSVTVELAADATLSDLLAVYDGEPCAVPVLPSDIAVVLFTSGSTGTPKAVLHSHRSLVWKARLMARVHDLGAGDAVCMPAPMAHVSGLLNGVLLPGAAGMKSVLMGRFDAEEAVAILKNERITFLAGPPTFFIAMSDFLRAGEPTPLRLISTGGASVSPAFVRSAAATFGCRVKRTYGSTEAPTVTTSVSTDPEPIAAETDGRAVGEVELRLDAMTGELLVRGPELFCGYVHGDVPLARGGWFRTGDLATIDEDGWLRIVGRLKDVIIRGGENISASEVESVLESHPHVTQAVAVGYPDRLMGEKVCAFIVASGAFDLDTCVQWFAERGVARFKTPERVEVIASMPLLGSGKPDRAALRKAALPR